MNKILFLLAVLVFAGTSILYAFGHGGIDYTPCVEYSKPADDHEVNLTGKDNLTFEWRPVPIPSGNRESYRFELFEENGDMAGGRIYSKDLAPDIFSIDIPANMFKRGAVYTWSVRQRDERTYSWSRSGNRWRFMVVK